MGQHDIKACRRNLVCDVLFSAYTYSFQCVCLVFDNHSLPTPAYLHSSFIVQQFSLKYSGGDTWPDDFYMLSYFHHLITLGIIYLSNAHSSVSFWYHVPPFERVEVL